MSAPVFEKISKIMKEESDVEVIGYVPKVKDLVLESRHLGLCLPSEIDDLKSKLMRLAEIFEETLNLDLLLKIAGEAPDIPFAEPAIPETGVHAKIALADDETFCFTYEDNIELLERCGAEFVRFSPMNDAELPPGVSGMILSGGYPELHAKILSENVSMRESVRKAIEAGMPCIAECGGFMYLHKEMEGSDGSKYPMAGAVDSKAENKNRLSRFGYITVKGTEGSVIGDREIKAHEFHYWDSDDFGCDCKATKASNGKEYQCMFCRDNMVAGYPHLYLYSNPEVASEFVARCSEFGKNRSG
jgi:cobyrinic acid a,c-diamide synthase